MDSHSQTYITRRSLNPIKEVNEKRRRKDSMRKVSQILRKTEALRTQEELNFLDKNSEITKQILKRKDRLQIYKERVIEKEDSIEELQAKAEKLSEIISQARHLICYTGAGISTSARIPDYRGSNGIWTLLQQGKSVEQHDLSLADPTYTHMALFQLYQRKILRFVVSQNCDGLHLRSGMPKTSLSEIHGNMYIEVCKNCKPNVEYWRLFDTTEITARYNHKTNRRCHVCGDCICDTIVHFGERGNLKWPLNWAGACHHAEKADVILCLGSSLKVMRKYHWLWHTDRPLKKRPKICIVNLQWTPKDKLATLKIHGKCDLVLRLVMKHLNINVDKYSKMYDPIFAHASLLSKEELHTVSQPMLKTHLENDEEKPTIVLGKGPLIRTPNRIHKCLKTNLDFKIRVSSSMSETENETEECNDLSNDSNESSEKNSQYDMKSEDSNKDLHHANPASNSIIKYIDTSSISIASNDENTTASVNCDNSTDLYCMSSPQLKRPKVLLPSRENTSNSTDFNLDRMPNWYDVRYAYSGLHSIVLPPPPEVNMWSSQIIPVFKMNRKMAECDFCFDTYAETSCQFYQKWLPEFSHTKIRNGNLIVCECCDFTEEEEEEEEEDNKNTIGTELTSNKLTKRIKSDFANGKKPVSIQAGWYGKGYRKGQYKKKGRRKDY